MKKVTFFLLLSIFGFGLGFSQDKGITYQAVIYKPGGEQLPGQNNLLSPLVNSSICLKFSFKDYLQNTEYQEIIRTRTDDFGVINLVIGLNEQTAGYANGFNDVVWNSSEKFLKVELDATDACTDFEEISNEIFNYVPFAFSAVNTQNVLGIVPIGNGGTGASNVAELKINLELNNIENTSDLNKPVSTPTQTALNLKETASNKSTDVSTDGTSDVKFPTVKSVKTYVDAEITTSNGASGTAITALKADVDQNESDSDAAESTLENNIKTLTSNVARNATTAAIATALKEDAANKSTTATLGTSDILFPTQNAVKTYVDTQTAAINTLADGAIYLGDTNGAAQEVTMTGDVSIDNAGVASIGTSKVVSSMIVDGTIVVGDVANAAVETAKIKDLNVTTSKIADANVTTAKIANANVTDAKLDKTGIPLSGFGAAEADVALGAKKLTGVADPSDAQDAATKAYVDTANSTNANLTGDVTSSGNATTIGVLSITNAQLAGSIDLTAKVTGVLPVANGGTGSATKNFVDLTTAQTVAGAKTFSSPITAGVVTYPNTHNSTAGEVLITDASGVANWGSAAATVREVADETSATNSQTSFTLTKTPSENSKVKMYINGIRISNTAYSVSGATLTYIEANNGSYALTASDRVQFDYFY